MPGVARLADTFACGDHVGEGSPTVFVNGLPIARLTDVTTGHDCFPPETIIQGSSTVFSENLAVARQGDLGSGHICGHSFHQTALSQVSDDTFSG